jgi:hypothetical protein
MDLTHYKYWLISTIECMGEGISMVILVEMLEKLTKSTFSLLGFSLSLG